jgi:SEC-C motif-containing protein
METKTCPCQSGRSSRTAAAPVIAGERKASTPEELMRARYSAYATAAIDFIIRLHPSRPEGVQRPRRHQGMGPEVRVARPSTSSHLQGRPEDKEGTVDS